MEVNKLASWSMLVNVGYNDGYFKRVCSTMVIIHDGEWWLVLKYR